MGGGGDDRRCTRAVCGAGPRIHRRPRCDRGASAVTRPADFFIALRASRIGDNAAGTRCFARCFAWQSRVGQDQRTGSPYSPEGRGTQAGTALQVRTQEAWRRSRLPHGRRRLHSRRLQLQNMWLQKNSIPDATNSCIVSVQACVSCQRAGRARFRAGAAAAACAATPWSKGRRPEGGHLLCPFSSLRCRRLREHRAARRWKAADPDERRLPAPPPPPLPPPPHTTSSRQQQQQQQLRHHHRCPPSYPPSLRAPHFLKSSTMSCSPSLSGTFGSHPSVVRALVMSGLRREGSSDVFSTWMICRGGGCD